MSSKISLAGNARSAAKPLLQRLLDQPGVKKTVPWIAGAGLAVGHAAVSSNCTVPTQGRCTTCGSCIVVIGSLVLWAVTKQRGGGNFYEEKSS